MLLPSIHKTLQELSDLIVQLSDEEFAKPCTHLSDATIGEHVRHIIEMFQCLALQYNSGLINYDKRNRNKRIQTNTEFAHNAIQVIREELEKPNIDLQLQQIVDGEEIRIKTNYFRELLYNLEHCIHHQALIKVAVLASSNLQIDANFGVARSTIEYRKQCAQ